MLQANTSGRVSVTTDLWSVSQTKASFMGITAHWIESDPKMKKWTLCTEVIAFRSISGAHDGHNLGRYFIGLCQHAGIIDHKDSKVCSSDLLSIINSHLDPPLIALSSCFVSQQIILETTIQPAITFNLF